MCQLQILAPWATGGRTGQMANVRPLIAGGSSERGREGLCPWLASHLTPDGMEGRRGCRESFPVPSSSASSGPRCAMCRSLIGGRVDMLGCRMGPTTLVLGSQQSVGPGPCWRQAPTPLTIPTLSSSPPLKQLVLLPSPAYTSSLFRQEKDT